MSNDTKFSDLLGSAVDMKSALDRREISSEELLDLHLEQVRVFNPPVNAIAHLHEEEARMLARESDNRRAQSGTIGDLDGLVMTIKDNIATAGIRTTAGVPFLADHVPDEDAPAVANLRAAGGILFGKTNLPPMAGDMQTESPLFGVTLNPWNRAFTPAGSSGGSAVALSLGLTPLEVGSDIAGSVRVPAHACGIYAHKPTLNLVSERGHIPPPPGSIAGSDLGTIGPMTRHARDLHLLLDVLAHRRADRPGWHPRMPAPRHTRLQDFRIGIWNADDVLVADMETQAMINDVAQRLENAGARVDRKTRPFEDIDAVVDAYLHTVLPFMLGDITGEQLQSLTPPGETHPGVLRMLDKIVHSRTDGWNEMTAAREVRARAVQCWEAFFQSYDAVICPVAPIPTSRIDQSQPRWLRKLPLDGNEISYWDQILWCGALANFAGLPATARPYGLSAEGLPMGFQIIGPFMEDYTPIELAALLDDLFGGFVPPPMLDDAAQSAG